MTGLQRLSALPVDTSVVALDEAIKSHTGPAVLISPDGWNQPEIPLPVSAPDAGFPMTLNAFGDDGEPTTTLTLEPALKFASLQTAYVGGRSVPESRHLQRGATTAGRTVALAGRRRTAMGRSSTEWHWCRWPAGTRSRCSASKTRPPPRRNGEADGQRVVAWRGRVGMIVAGVVSGCGCGGGA